MSANRDEASARRQPLGSLVLFALSERSDDAHTLTERLRRMGGRRPSLGSVRRELERLEHAGLVASSRQRPHPRRRSLFHLTDAGRLEATASLETLRSVSLRIQRFLAHRELGSADPRG